jgi:hypothetical protein
MEIGWSLKTIPMKFDQYFKLKDLLKYFFTTHSSTSSKSVRMMHLVNKLAIVMFVIALVVMLYRAFLR